MNARAGGDYIQPEQGVPHEALFGRCFESKVFLALVISSLFPLGCRPHPTDRDQGPCGNDNFPGRYMSGDRGAYSLSVPVGG